jgi:hypothetical protein
MSEITIIAPMTQDEARDCINRLRQHLTDARTYAHVLYTREGWKALGYTSLKECFITELGASWQHGYRLINAAEVDQDLSEFSPIGENFVIPVTHARHLHKLPSEKRYVAYDRAKTLASTEGAKQVTARHVEKAVEQIEAEISLQDNPVVARAVAAGEITPADGVKIHHELTALPLQHQAKVLTIMTEHGLRDPRLVAPLAEMATRPAGRVSKVLEEIERTGYVAGVPLREASLSDLEKLKEEARREHISEGIEAKRQQQMAKGGPVTEVKVITVYVHEPMKTLNALVRALPLDDLKAVAELMMTHVIAEMEKEQ